MSTDTETTRRLVRTWIELANARELDSLREVWADDLVLHQGNDVPALEGFDAFKALLEVFYAGMPDLQIEIEEIVASGDIAIVRSTSRGTHTADLMGLPASGRSVAFAGLGTFRVADGKIVEEWFNDDLFGLMQQLGAIPS